MVSIETPRLIIRRPKPVDAKPLNEAINRSLGELQKWMPWSFDPSLKTTEVFIEKAIESWKSTNQSDFPLIIELKDNGGIISASGYNDRSDPTIPYYEIGYWLDSKYVGNGYATEMTNALTRYAFDHLNAVRVQIRAQCENSKSIAVAKRCGFSQEAILKKVKRDCRTQKPCDDVVLVCFDTKSLPKLEYKIL